MSKETETWLYNYLIDAFEQIESLQRTILRLELEQKIFRAALIETDEAIFPGALDRQRQRILEAETKGASESAHVVPRTLHANAEIILRLKALKDQAD